MGFRRLRPAVAGLAAGAITALPTVPTAATPANAIPIRGNTAWSVLLCKFSDHAEEPQTPQFFANFLTTAGTGGLADYYSSQSGGEVALTGSVVRGWYSMRYTQAQEAAKNRAQRIQDCVDTALGAGYTVPAGNRTIVILNALVDSGSAGGRTVLDPGAWNVAFAAHEMGHGYGLNHSYSDDLNYRNATWSQPGEYDDEWDEMSAMNVLGAATPSFGTGAVGFNAYHRDNLGWLARTRVKTFGADGVGSATLTVAPLNYSVRWYTTGPKLVRVPFDPGDPFHYYTVEYVRKLGWDNGLPANTVLLREVKGGASHLLRAHTGARAPVQTLSANGVRITVNSTSRFGASVTISSDITTRCLSGYVWRAARPSDLVCVIPATRTQVAADNTAAAGRTVGGGSTCLSGYVWREAYVGDLVCVPPATRSKAWADNAAAAGRVNPARFVYGPNTCASGYVWRDIDVYDYVCVPPATRTQAAADNAAAASRRVVGSATCVSGYVWRVAFPADLVCVTPSVRTQTRLDNAQAASRVMRPAGG
jgi:hypothetical protein